MYEADPCGHLLVKGRALSDRALAIQAGMTEVDVQSAMVDLETNGVFSRRPDGTVFSRKMVRDARKSAEQRKRAQARWTTENVDEIKSGNSEMHAEPMPRSQKPEARVQKEDLSPSGDSSFSGNGFDLIPAKPDHVQQAFDAYNLMARAHGLASASKLTDKRRAALKNRLREIGLPEWIRAIEKVPAAPFLLGQNAQGWRADLDFLLQPTSLQKVLEGSYEGSRNGRPSSDRESRFSKFQQGLVGFVDRGR
jgi:hypothetical protein